VGGDRPGSRLGRRQRRPHRGRRPQPDRHRPRGTGRRGRADLRGAAVRRRETDAASGAGERDAPSYHPQGLRPYIVNWEATAAAFTQWLHRDFLRTGDAETKQLLDELLAYPDVPHQWQALDLDASTAPFLAIELKKGDVRFSFFTLLASLGTPYDITLHELRIECFFAADAATDAALRRL
jgi:MmyB-like transcription regulator ligand binding domain